MAVKIAQAYDTLLAAGRECVFQSYAKTAHKARNTQAWQSNLIYNWSLDLWPNSRPHCDLLNYYMHDVPEAKVMANPHNSKDVPFQGIVAHIGKKKSEHVYEGASGPVL